MGLRELTITKGELLHVLTLPAPAGWVLGRNSTGALGLIPASYLAVEGAMEYSGAGGPAAVAAEPVPSRPPAEPRRPVRPRKETPAFHTTICDSALEEELSKQRAADQSSALAFGEIGSLVAAVRRGDVLLMRASWLMERAGYDAADVQTFSTFSRTCRWVRRRAAKPLPSRQAISITSPVLNRTYHFEDSSSEFP